jgi:hypothetical protein
MTPTRIKTKEESKNNSSKPGFLREKYVLRAALTMAVLVMAVRSIFEQQPFLVGKGESTGNIKNVTIDQAVTSSSNRHTAATKAVPQWQPRPPMTLFVRMSGTMSKHRRRWYCTFFRSTALFWNIAFTNRIILLLDDEVPTDHEFGTTLSHQVAQEFPEFQLQVKYEPVPKDKFLLSKKSGQEKRPLGYRRQLYSSFLTDQYIGEDVGMLIVFMDNDAMFFSPVTLSSILDAYNRPRVFGSDCTYPREHVTKWYQSTIDILGFPMISDFMSYFPVYIYADTIRNCRQYLLTRFGGGNASSSTTTPTFEEIYPLISPPGRNMSPVCVLLSYAWYFERERYSWSFEVCDYPSKRNGAIANPQHYMGSDDVTETLPVPQTAFHKPYAIDESKVAHMTYCFAALYLLNATGRSDTLHRPLHLQHPLQLAADCLDKQRQQRRFRYTWMHLYVLFVPNLQYMYQKDVAPPRCKGANEFDCIARLDRHFQEYAQEVQQEHRPPLDWSRTDRVSAMAQQAWNITCSPIVELSSPSAAG